MPVSDQSLTIGAVVERLRGDYPDLSISKVRFLEEEGLIAPERTPGGYRKFGPADVRRLELVLKLQKDRFMPLAVIREKLAEYDQGRMPAELQPAISRSEEMTLPLEEAESVPVSRAPEALGLPEGFVRQLAEFNLIALVDGEHGKEIPAADVGIAHACWDLRRFGVEPRHLRIYETFAEREATFLSQILMPTFRHRTPETRQKLLETLDEITALTGELKKRMLHRAIAEVFEDVV